MLKQPSQSDGKMSLQGREQEVTLSDLHHIAEEEQQAWFDETDSRQVMSRYNYIISCPTWCRCGC